MARGEVTASEQRVLQRVLDALLREDHLGLSTRGRQGAQGQWMVSLGSTRLRIPIRPDGFQHDLRSAASWFVVERADGSEQVIATVEGLLAVLAPAGDPEAEAGWADFTEECHGELLARRLAAQTWPRISSAWPHTGMAGAQGYEVLAAHADHPVHPTSRCRHGLNEADLLAYAPEHAPVFPLRWLSVPRAELTLSGTLPGWWPAAENPEYALMPAHPLTVRRLGLAVTDGPEILVRPTLSMRTVALVDDPYTHLKLPLATATLGSRNKRMIAPGTLTDGMEMQRLLQRLAAAEPTFARRILHADEQTFGHAGTQDRAFMVRRYPTDLQGCTVIPVAALAAPDPSGSTVAERVSSGDPQAVLDPYLDLLVDWHVYLWLRHGIALEAHQQNIHLVIDPDGTTRLLYKDNDGARLQDNDGARLQDNDGARLHIASDDIALDDGRMRVRDPGELADVFTTITLHLAAAAPLLALADRGLAVPSPAEALRGRLLVARDRWGCDESAEILTIRVLDAERLPVKAMLTAGTLLPKHRIGCADINKHYLRTGPNYLRTARTSATCPSSSGEHDDFTRSDDQAADARRRRRCDHP